MKEVSYVMGKMPKQRDTAARTIDFIVTEDCNLRCKYCYLVGKNDERKMSLEVAKRAVDFCLADSRISNTPGVTWQMGGGEAFLEIDLIDQLTDYIKEKMEQLDHPWRNNYMFSICSNGLLYSSPKVQQYLKKNSGNVGVVITVDGNKDKHDGSRVFADGSGSYDRVVKNAKLWMQQYPKMPRSTKSTFSHDDLPYLKDSIINLWNLGIQYVMANVVFEDVWQEGDDILFENQLKELADYVLENELWKEHSVRFFDPSIGFKLTEDDLDKSFCGSGSYMLAIDSEGKLYPCMRFTGFSITDKVPLAIGDIENGIDENRLRPFMSFDVKSISNQQCIQCDVASGCAYCAGFNYNAADTDTIFQRATYNCKMHKANVRACEYFWEKFKQVTGLESLRDEHRESRRMLQLTSKEDKYLLFVLNNQVTPHCSYTSKNGLMEEMSKEVFEKGMNFARKNHMIPILLGDTVHQYTHSPEAIAVTSCLAPHENENSIVVFDEEVTNVVDGGACIVLISKNTVGNLYEFVEKIKKHYIKINVTIKDLLQWGDDERSRYREQLDKLIELVVRDAKEGHIYQFSNLTDLLKLSRMNNCDAGENTFSLAPNGKLYLCPAFYFEEPSSFIGSLDDGVNIPNENILEIEHAPICRNCDACQCSRCKFLNLKATGELNTPSRQQCTISHIEREATRKLQLRLQEEGMAPFMEVLPELDYMDPYEKILRSKRLVPHQSSK